MTIHERDDAEKIERAILILALAVAGELAFLFSISGYASHIGSFAVPLAVSIEIWRSRE